MTKPYIVGAAVLGGYGQVASWRRSDPDHPVAKKWGPVLCLMQGETSEEGILIPARDVTISGREALLALRAAIDEALKEESAAAP